MLESLDALILARLQFAFTISFHFLFPAFTIGLASWLAVLEWRWLSTGNPVYVEIFRMSVLSWLLSCRGRSWGRSFRASRWRGGGLRAPHFHG